MRDGRERGESRPDLQGQLAENSGFWVKLEESDPAAAKADVDSLVSAGVETPASLRTGFPQPVKPDVYWDGLRHDEVVP